jgi:Na+-driven multidrug efflux pump
VPLAWVLGITMKLGLIGIWMAGGVYAAGLASLMALEFKRGNWKKIAL